MKYLTQLAELLPRLSVDNLTGHRKRTFAPIPGGSRKLASLDPSMHRVRHHEGFAVSDEG